MPTKASEAEAKTMLANAAGAYGRLANVLFEDGNSSYVWADDQLTDDLDGEYMSDRLDLHSAIRDALAASLQNIAADADISMREYADIIGRTNLSSQQAWEQTFEYWQENSIRVKSREWSFGAPSAAASNVGTGTIRRLSTDKYGQTIESGASDSFRADCVQDRFSGPLQSGQEVFAVESLPLGADDLHPEGEGIETTIVGVNAANSTAFLTNPSFDAALATFSAGASAGTSGGTVTAINGYTLSTTANLKVVNYNTYRTFEGEATPGSLLIKNGDAKVTQLFAAQVNNNFQPGTPYYMQIAYNRAGLAATSATAGAAIKMKLGKLTHTLTTSTESGWNIHTITLDEDCWYDNWTEDAAGIEISTSGLSAGGLLIDDIVLTPMARIGARYAVLVGGATPFSRGGNGGQGDRFDWTDAITAADTAHTQNLMAARGWYLPASTTANSYTEPSI